MAHERYRRQTDDRQTDGRQQIANVAKNQACGSVEVVLRLVAKAFDCSNRDAASSTADRFSELTFTFAIMLSAVRPSSVDCLSSVCNARAP